jgi:hypothetical protein
MKRQVLVLLILLAAACSQGETSTEPTGAPEETTTSTVPSPPPPPTEVPNVTGEQTDAARTLLQDAELTVLVEKKYSHEPKGVVLKQTPRPGRLVDRGSTIEILVAQPFPRIPNVTTKKLTQARRILRNAGFRVAVKKQESTTQREGDIVSQNPPGGTEARPDRLVTLIVINNICTPGYSPCLREGPSDYDCYGGSGNGPAYTSPGVTYRVTGLDPYDLDGNDNDGYGCE